MRVRVLGSERLCERDCEREVYVFVGEEGGRLLKVEGREEKRERSGELETVSAVESVGRGTLGGFWGRKEAAGRSFQWEEFRLLLS
ncbi:MAG: hypothetical protein ACTS4U_00090 [Candidatus Hodgkinia cicadicola]